MFEYLNIRKNTTYRVVLDSSDIKFGLTIFKKDLWGKGLSCQAVIKLLEKWLARVKTLVDDGKIEWKSMSEIYDAYLIWKNS